MSIPADRIAAAIIHVNASTEPDPKISSPAHYTTNAIMRKKIRPMMTIITRLISNFTIPITRSLADILYHLSI